VAKLPPVALWQDFLPEAIGGCPAGFKQLLHSAVMFLLPTRTKCKAETLKAETLNFLFSAFSCAVTFPIFSA
jgi:hypothetical protein